jgi:hypothetical protein
MRPKDWTSLCLEPDIFSTIFVFPVMLDLIACRDTEFQDEAQGNLVFLGIKGKGLSLFCTEIQGQPTLQLKVSGYVASEKYIKWAFYLT